MHPSLILTTSLHVISLLLYTGSLQSDCQCQMSATTSVLKSNPTPHVKPLNIALYPLTQFNLLHCALSQPI